MATRNIQAYCGQTYTHTLRLKDATGLPIDISADSFQAKVGTNDGTLIGVFTCTIVDGPNGILTVTANSATTAAWITYLGVQEWKLWRNNAPLLDGTCIVKRGMPV
jgi:hypothetical protein